MRRRRAVAVAFVGALGVAAVAVLQPPTGGRVEGSPDSRLLPAEPSVAGAAIPGTDDVFYFAYGANMDHTVFAERRRLHSTSSEAARAPGHELVFAAIGVNRIEPAFAALRRADGHEVHGVLYRLPRREVPRLHRLESGYETFYVDVIGARAGAVRAFTYNVPALTFGLKPSRRYVATLCRGARQHGLPLEYVAVLEREPVTYIPLLSPLAERVVPVFEAALRGDP